MANSILVLISLVICNGTAADPGVLAGQDLHLTAPVVTVCRQPQADWSHWMLLEGGATVQIGDNRISSQNAAISLMPQSSDDPTARTTYLAKVYFEGDIAIEQGRKAKTTAVQHFIVEGADVLVTQFLVTGEVFAVSDQQQAIDCEGLFAGALYQRSAEALAQLPTGPGIPSSALVPDVDEQLSGRATELARIPGVGAAPADSADGTALPLTAAYPVHLSAVWETTPQIEKRPTADGREVVTASGRFYVWQQRSEGSMVEFLADNLVIFFAPDAFAIDPEAAVGNQIGSGKPQSVYLEGNIVMTEGERTIRADEIYYDFVNERALVVNASMRVFDEKRGLPIYVRADRLGQVSEHIFEADNVQLTTSEFYFPQVSLNASRMVLLKDEAVSDYVKAAAEADVGARYEARLHDVTAQYGGFSFFHWDKMTTNFKRPDLPLSRISVGSDSDFGTSVETRWHLARLLGLKDPPWLESRLAADYFSKRGVGGGIEAEYGTEQAKGSLVAYIMNDRGTDDLGRTDSRRNLDPNQDIRGRFSFRHRQWLEDDWQLTTEVSYISDRNFLEWMYRDEFNTDKAQETVVYLKRLRDNWAFSILGKMRINDFETMTEELPSLEYHRTGQSFWDHRLTWYSDSQVARFRERLDDDASRVGWTGGEFYTFAYTRNEVDMPLTLGTVKLVPFVAGSYGFEDGQGYGLDLDGNATGSREDNVLLGEVGLRASTTFWKEDPHVRSALWDLDGLRHIVTPYAEAVLYEANDEAADMRDAIHLGLSQRWQTHRGSDANKRSLDWMRLDVETTWVDNDADSSIGPVQTYGPAGFVYNDPSIPLLLRRGDNYYGMVRDTVTGDFIWRVSDVLSILSDINYDIDSGCVQQFNLGMSRYVYPDISYYLGTRYLRPVIVEDVADGIHEEGSNAVLAAVTYRLTPRYTATFSQEYNFDFGGSVRSDLTLIRQYHRMFYALTLSVDESLKRDAILFSIWPQGVDELAVGSRRYTGLTGAQRED